MSRKPLIPPGSILPEQDTMSRILERDRAKTGRGAPSHPAVPENTATDNDTSPIVITQDDVMTIGQPDSDDSAQAGNAALKPAGRQRGPSAGSGQAEETRDAASRTRRGRTGTKGKEAPPDPLAERVARAASMAKSPTTTVTLRLPAELNAWLDEYIHRAWPERVKKQELVVEALRMLVARRGSAGDPVVPTPLLGDED